MDKKEEKKITKDVVKNVKKFAKKAEKKTHGSAQKKKKHTAVPISVSAFHSSRKGAMSSRDSPEVFRGKLLALSQRFPMMLTGCVGPGSSSNFLEMPCFPMSSMQRVSLPFITVGAPVAGTNYFYAYLAVFAGGYWLQQVQLGNAMAVTDGIVSGFSTLNNPLKGLADSLINTNQTNGICIRLMNASPLLTAGGEVLMGTIPSSIGVAATVNWATLLTYVDVSQVDIPQAQDVCYPWMPICTSDNATQAVATGASVSANTSCVFCFVRVPYSATVVPAMDVEIYCNFTGTPLPAYQKFLNAKVQMVDETGYTAARRTLGMGGKSSICIHPTASISQMFAEAARALGPAVMAYVGKHMPKFMDDAASMIGNLFGDMLLHKQMLLLCDNKRMPLVLAGMRRQHILPEKLIRLLEELNLYTVNFNNDAVLVQHPGVPDHLVERATIMGPFGERTEFRYESGCVDDDEKSVVDCGDALSYALKKPRTSSLPPTRK